MANVPAPLGPKTLVVLAPARADIDEQLAYIARTAGLDVALRFADAIDRAPPTLPFSATPGYRATGLGRDYGCRSLEIIASISA